MFYNIPDDSKKLYRRSQHCTAQVVKLKLHVLQLLNVLSHNIMSLLRDMKLMSRDRIFLSSDKSVDLGSYHFLAYGGGVVETG